MTDVVELRPSKSKVPTLKDHFGNDDWLLEICAQWRIVRARQQQIWAEHEQATGWGYLSDENIQLDTTQLRRMREIEANLAQAQPRTALLATELLRIALTILTRQVENPEHALAEGPVLEIVR